MHLYCFLDWFFILFHTALIFFNLFGWVWRKSRKWNLAVLLITAASWYLLGYFYGWGYCFLTDWHWQVLGELGAYPSENSYVQYLFRRLLGIRVTYQFADILTGGLFFVALLISLLLNVKDYFLKRKISAKNNSNNKPT